MATHHCPSTACAMNGHGGWSAPMGIINRPCGHSFATACGCYERTYVTNGVNTSSFSWPEPEYVGRHRKDA